MKDYSEVLLSDTQQYRSYAGGYKTGGPYITEYEFYEKKSVNRFSLKCMDGRVYGCSKCVGYCRYYGHPGFLTGKLRQEHDCLGKGCAHYVPKERSGSRTMTAAEIDIYIDRRIRAAESWADFVVSSNII